MHNGYDIIHLKEDRQSAEFHIILSGEWKILDSEEHSMYFITGHEKSLMCMGQILKRCRMGVNFSLLLLIPDDWHDVSECLKVYQGVHI